VSRASIRQRVEEAASEPDDGTRTTILVQPTTLDFVEHALTDVPLLLAVADAAARLFDDDSLPSDATALRAALDALEAQP